MLKFILSRFITKCYHYTNLQTIKKIIVQWLQMLTDMQVYYLKFIQMYYQSSKTYIGKLRSGERSVPKESQPTYEKYTTTYGNPIQRFPNTPTRKIMSPDFPKSTNYVSTIKTSQDDQDTAWGPDINRGGSETNLSKTQHQQKLPRFSRRKNDGMVSTLKSQLQNLKLQVNKLMSKQQETHKSTKSSQQPSYFESSNKIQLEDESKSQGQQQLDNDDLVSVTSQRIIDQPIRQLAKKASALNYDHGHYMELENDLLKTELRNLKNKYNAKKVQLSQKCQALEKKNQYLQIALHRSQEMSTQYKNALDIQIQTIKTQIARKYQSQLKHSQQKYEQLIKLQQNQPEKDSDPGNQVIKEKLKKLYEQLAQKNKQINNMNIELNEVKGQKQKFAFEVRKQKQKNNQLFKQFQLSRRQLSRKQEFLQVEIIKRKQLVKNLDKIKQENTNLIKELDARQKQVSGSQMHENKLSEELKTCRVKQNQYKSEIAQLKSKIKKLTQLNESDQIEIQHLKKSNQQSMKQIQNVSKMFRQQKQKVVQTEEKYRKMMEEAKKRSQEQVQLLKHQYTLMEKNYEKNNSNQKESKNEKHTDSYNQALKEKDRLISKWKAQYKLLKIKFEQRQSVENNKKSQIESYYQGYTQSKHKIEQLQYKNTQIFSKNKELIEKLKKIEAENLRIKTQARKDKDKYNIQKNAYEKQIIKLHRNEQALKKKIQEETNRSEKQMNYRKDIQLKIFQMSPQDEEALQEIIQTIKKRVSEQDQKMTKQLREIRNKDAQLKELRQQIRELMTNKQEQLSKMRQRQIDELKNQFFNDKLAFVEEFQQGTKVQLEAERQKYSKLLAENTTMKMEITDLQKQLSKYKTENQSILHLYNAKVVEHEQQINKFNTQRQLYQQRLSESRMQKLQYQANISNEIKAKNEEINSLRDQIRRRNNMIIDQGQLSSLGFDDVLKTQIQTVQKLREEISKKTEQVFKVRDQYSSLRTQYDNMKSEQQIIKLKHLSEKKNLGVNYDVEIQNLKNQLTIEEKKISSMNQKLQLTIEENKKKDQFIQSYIINKKLPQNDKEFILEFIKKYEMQLTGKTINQKLQQDSKELQKITIANYNLLRQMAQMKDKMLLYEATSPEKTDSLANSGSFQDFAQMHKAQGGSNIKKRPSTQNIQSPKSTKSHKSPQR